MSKKIKLTIQNIKEHCQGYYEINTHKAKNPPVFVLDNICKTGKICYETKRSAYNAIKGMSNKRGGVGVYKCELCNNFHTGRHGGFRKKKNFQTQNIYINE